MSSESPTITVRLSKKLLAAVDKKIKREKLTRSRAVQLALAAWVGEPELGEPMPEGAAAFTKKARREASRAGVKARWGEGAGN